MKKKNKQKKKTEIGQQKIQLKPFIAYVWLFV